MKNRDMRLYITDIWDSIVAIEEYTGTITEKEFCSNRQAQDAVIRRLEIIGEAVKNIDEDFRNKYLDVPWKKIAGLRDIIVHEYFGIKLERIWEVARKENPLKEKFASAVIPIGRMYTEDIKKKI